MIRSFLTAVLLATQLSGGTAAPLYVCLASDGSVGMHLGSGECGCQHEETGCDEHVGDCHCRHRHHEGELAHYRERSPAPAVHAVVSDSCGCTHIQITKPQDPTIVTKLAVGPENEVVLPIAAVASTSHFAIATNAFGLQPALFIGGNSLPLLQLETVALRC